MITYRTLVATLVASSIACLVGCNSSSREFVEPTDAQLSSEAKGYLADFIAKSRQSKKLNVTEIEPVLESLEGYREAVGEKINPVVDAVTKLKTAAESNAKPKEFAAIIDELEKAIAPL